MYCRILILLTFLGCGTLLPAQETLSLSDAIQIGLARNYDISIEQKNVTIATNNNAQGEAGRYPSITLNVNQNNSLTDNVKTASPFQLQDQTISNSFNPGVNLNWTLFNGFKINMSKQRLEQLQAESSGNASVVIANSLQAIILGYYLVLLEKDRLDEFQKQLKLSRDKYSYMETKSELGSAVTSDLLLEEGNYLTDSVNLINQQFAYRNALRDLNVLLGQQNVETDYSFTDELSFSDENFEYSALRSKMTNENIDLRKQFISQSLTSTNIRLAKADRYPSLILNAGFSDNRSRVDLSNASFPNGDGTFSPGPNDPLNAITDTYFANFTLSFTLFNGGKINRAIKNAIVQEDIGNLRVEKLKNMLERDLQRVYDQYQIRKILFGINERREEAARINLDISADKYRNGSINSFDYRIVQNNYLSSSILKLQALYNLIDSKVQLMRLTGGIVEEYIN